MPVANVCRFLILLTAMALAVPIVAQENSPSAKTPPAKTPAVAARRIQFQQDIAPILQKHCVDCHGPVLKLAGLRLDQRRLALAGGESGSPIHAGNSKESLLIERLVNPKAGIIMPPSFPFFPGEKVGLADEQINLLKAWIDQGADWPEDVELSAGSRQPPDPRLVQLAAAIRRGDRAVVAELLEEKSIVEAVDNRGNTPLMLATMYADADFMRMLLARGADVNHENDDGTTALVLAAHDVEKIRVLLERGAKVDARTKMGRTPLLIAATYAGNVEGVKLLLQSGAQIRDMDANGETVLTGAAKRGDVRLVEELIAAGADLEAGGRPPLFWVTEEGNLETLACLLKHGAGKNPAHVNMALFNAAVRGPKEAIRLLLDAGGDPNAASPLAGYTPLMGVAYSELLSVEIVQLLLDKGANPKEKTQGGVTALQLAQKRGNTKVVELLRQAGATD